MRSDWCRPFRTSSPVRAHPVALLSVIQPKGATLPSITNFQTFNDELEARELIDAIREAEPDVPIVSNSQINSFDRCELQYSLGYVEKWEQRDTKSYLQIGTLGHELLSAWYKTGSWEQVELAWKEQYDKYAFQTEYMPILAEVIWLVRRYIEQFVPSNDAPLQAVAVEQHFVLALWTAKGRKYYLQGYIDLAQVDTSNNNMLWLADHKFSTKRMSVRECEMDPQLPRYAAAYAMYGYDVFGVYYNMLNTYEYKKEKESVPPDKLFKRELVWLNRARHDNALIETGRAVDDLVEFLDSGKPARRRQTRDCSRCWFQGPCAFGLKGDDMNTLLLADFRKKGSDNNPQRLDRYPKTGEYRDDVEIHL